jgi:hypothetical protein
MNYMVATYIVRILGILLVIPAMFPSWFLNWFPGLEDRRVSWVLFALGIAIYGGASLIFFIFNKKEQARRRREMRENGG